MSQEAAKAAKEAAPASKGEDKEVRAVVQKRLRDVEKRVKQQKAASSRDLAEVSPRVDARVDGVHGHEARETPSFLGRLSAALGHSGQGVGSSSRLDLG